MQNRPQIFSGKGMGTHGQGQGQGGQAGIAEIILHRVQLNIICSILM